MVLALAIQVHREREVLARLEQVHLLFQQQRVGAQVHILAARDQPRDDFANLGMQQRFAAGNVHDRSARLFHRAEALFRRHLALQHMRRILHLAATGTGQIAAEQHLQHHHQRVVLAPLEPVLEHITAHRPHLRDRNCH